VAHDLGPVIPADRPAGAGDAVREQVLGERPQRVVDRIFEDRDLVGEVDGEAVNGELAIVTGRGGSRARSFPAGLMGLANTFIGGGRRGT